MVMYNLDEIENSIKEYGFAAKQNNEMYVFLSQKILANDEDKEMYQNLQKVVKIDFKLIKGKYKKAIDQANEMIFGNHELSKKDSDRLDNIFVIIMDTHVMTRER